MIQRLRADVRSDDSSRGAAKSCCQMYQVAGGVGGGAAAPPMMLEEVMIHIGVQCNLGGTSKQLTGGCNLGGTSKTQQGDVRAGVQLNLDGQSLKSSGHPPYDVSKARNAKDVSRVKE